MVDIPLSPSFRLGPLIGRIARVLLHHAGPVLGLNLVPSIPALVLLAATGLPLEDQGQLNLIPTILSPVLSLFAVGMTAGGTYRSLRGESFLTAGTAARTLRRSLPLIGASVLSWLLVMAGLAAFVAPGLMAIATLFVVVPVCVVERQGSVASMERAAHLTSGHRWTVFALFLLTAAPLLAISALLGDFSPDADPSVARGIGDEVVSLLYLSITGVALGVSYEALRAVDDGEAGRFTTAFD